MDLMVVIIHEHKSIQFGPEAARKFLQQSQETLPVLVDSNDGILMMASPPLLRLMMSHHPFGTWILNVLAQPAESPTARRVKNEAFP